MLQGEKVKRVKSFQADKKNKKPPQVQGKLQSRTTFFSLSPLTWKPFFTYIKSIKLLILIPKIIFPFDHFYSLSNPKQIFSNNPRSFLILNLKGNPKKKIYNSFGRRAERNGEICLECITFINLNPSNR